MWLLRPTSEEESRARVAHPTQVPTAPGARASPGQHHPRPSRALAFRIGCLMKRGSVSTPAPRRAVRNSSLCGAPDQASGPRVDVVQASRARCRASRLVSLAASQHTSRPSRAQCLLRRGLATRRASAPPSSTPLMKWGSVRLRNRRKNKSQPRSRPDNHRRKRCQAARMPVGGFATATQLQRTPAKPSTGRARARRSRRPETTSPSQHIRRAFSLRVFHALPLVHF